MIDAKTHKIKYISMIRIISMIRTVSVGAILIDLWKAFDTIKYDLLIAKLQAYGFAKNALDLVYSYLKNKKQRMKINTTFSTSTNLISRVSQESVLSPLLFNVYLNDLSFFLQVVNICKLLMNRLL